MTAASSHPDNAAVRTPAPVQAYASSFAPRPHALTPPGAQPSRLTELVAVLAWIVSSWLSPADADVNIKQRTGREHREP